MINREKTKIKYNYFPEDLALTSNQSVVWSCDKCGKEKDQAYAYALKKKAKAEKEKKQEVCQSCGHEHRKGKFIKNETPKNNPVTLPPEVNMTLTMERYGVNAEDLSPWSRQKIVLNCACGRETETKRCNLNASKSIQETGHYKCTGCWTQERRRGVKVSQVTKQKMVSAQRKRRGTYEKEVLPMVANGENFSSPRQVTPGTVIPFNKDKK